MEWVAILFVWLLPSPNWTKIRRKFKKRQPLVIAR